jgi:hypothetical protein
MTDRVNRYTGSFKRTSGGLVENQFNPGPFVAIVRSHLDSKYMGNLEVELLTKTDSGSRTKTSGIITPVSYLSPFYSATPYQGVTDNEGHKASQKAAGMWFVPPDLGARVLVIFAEGGQGFWIGCIQDEYTNMAVPAPDTATTYNEVDRAAKLPVGEYNKKKGTATGDDPTKFLKPANDDQINVLEIQGLLEDETRGLTSSSARREIPSAVFGISTPGPYDRRPRSPQTKYGLIDDSETTKIYHNRLGGSSLIFDDGDASKLREKPASEAEPVYVDREAGGEGGDVTIPHNEMLRLKTRTGHQILMHNSEDLIYITNAKGTAWIELTANGKIDIYSEDSISVHTENDLNFTADRDINFEAKRDVNLQSRRDTAIHSDKYFQLRVGENSKITTLGNLDLYTKKNTTVKVDKNTSILSKNTFIHSEENFEVRTCLDNRIESVEANTQITSRKNNNFTAVEQNTNILSGGNHVETASIIHMNGPQAATAEPPKTNIQIAIEAAELPVFELPKRIELPGAGGEGITDMPDAPEDVIESMLKRVPQHEPWYHHENLNPLFYPFDLTDTRIDHVRVEIEPEEKDACASPVVLKSIWFEPVSLVPPETAKYIPSGDTFRKGGN